MTELNLSSLEPVNNTELNISSLQPVKNDNYNEALINTPFQTQQQQSVLEPQLSNEEMEKLKFKKYNEEKFGQIFTDSQLEEQKNAEYGNITFKEANEINSSALKHTRKKSIGANVIDGLAGTYTFLTRIGEFDPFGLKELEQKRFMKTSPNLYGDNWYADKELGATDDEINLRYEQLKKEKRSYAIEVSDSIKKQVPKEYREAQNIIAQRALKPIEGNALQQTMGFFDRGLNILTQQADFIAAGAGGGIVQFSYVAGKTRDEMFGQLDGLVDNDIVDIASDTYMLAAGIVEYSENIGRVSSAFGTDKLQKFVRNTVLRKLFRAGVNVTEEMLQKLFEDLIYNEAVSLQNERYGTNLELREIVDKDGYTTTAVNSLALSTILEAFGLGTKGLKKTYNKLSNRKATNPTITKGDAKLASESINTEQELIDNVNAKESTDEGRAKLTKAITEQTDEAIDDYNNFVSPTPDNDILGDLGQQYDKNISNNIVVGEKGNQFFAIEYDDKGNVIETTSFDFTQENKRKKLNEFDDYVDNLELKENQKIIRYEEQDGSFLLSEEQIDPIKEQDVQLEEVTPKTEEIVVKDNDDQQILDEQLNIIEQETNPVARDLQSINAIDDKRGDQQESKELTPPDTNLSIDNYETQSIIFFSRLRDMGLITNKKDYNDYLDQIEQKNEIDYDIIYNESVKAYRSIKKKIESANSLGRAKVRRTVYDKSFRPTTKVIIDELNLLNRELRLTVKNIAKGKQLGKKQQKEAQKQLELKRKLLKERAKRILDIYVQDRKTKNEFANRINNLRTEKGLDILFNQIRDKVQAQRKRDSELLLIKTLKKAQSIKEWIPRLEEKYNITTSKLLKNSLSEEKIKTLESRKEFIEGNPINYIPLKQLKQLDQLTATSIKDLDADKIDRITKQLQTLVTLNNNFIKHKKAVDKLSAENQIKELVNHLKTEQSQKGTSKNILNNKFLNNLRKAPFIIEELDGGQNQGVTDTLLRFPMQKSAEKEYDLQVPTYDRLAEIYKILPKNWFNKNGRSSEEITINDKTLTVDEIMGLYANSKNSDNRKAVRKNNKFKNQKQINDFINKLTDAEKSVVDQIMILMDNQYVPMADIAVKLTNKKPPRVTNYYPLIFKSKTQQQYNDDNDLLKDTSTDYLNPYVDSGFTQERVGSNREVNLSFVHTSERHLRRVNHYIAYAETANNIKKILRSKNVRNQIERIVGKQGLKEIDSWFINSVNPSRSNIIENNGIEDIAKALRLRLSVVYLGLNFVSGLAQFSSFGLTARRIGFKNAISGLVEYLSVKDGINPMKRYKEINERSSMMAMRTKSFDREYRDYMADQRYKRLFKKTPKLQDAFFIFLRTIDSITAYSSWLGAYNKGYSIYKDDAAAIRYADDVVSKTQPMSDVTNLASIQRGSELQKLFTPFYTALGHVYNEMDTQTRGAIKKNISFTEYMASMFWIVLVPAIYNTIIRNPEEMKKLVTGEGDEETIKVFGQGLTGYLAGTVPIVGGAIGSFFNEYPYTPVPAFDAVKYGDRLLKAIGKGDVGKATENAIITGGFFFKYPSKQAARTLTGAYDLITDETDDLRRLIYSEYVLEGDKKKRKKKFNF